MSSESLEKYLRKMSVDAKFLRFSDHTMTVEAAVNLLGISKEKIVKSILFIDDSGRPVFAMATGDKRVDEKKLAALCGAKKVRKANSIEVKELTGYEVGAVPPVGHRITITTFIDRKVMRFDRVVGGGGDINTLLEISPAAIRKLTGGKITNISE